MRRKRGDGRRSEDFERTFGSFENSLGHELVIADVSEHAFSRQPRRGTERE
jgi:hypothetical protein